MRFGSNLGKAEEGVFWAGGHPPATPTPREELLLE